MTEASGWEGILEPGETVLWQGQPMGDILWRDMISDRLPIGIIFTLFSLAWIGVAFSIVAGIEGAFFMALLFPLAGLPFLAIGLYMLVGHLWWDAMVRRSTWYTLTDRRAFIATDIFARRKLQSYPITDMAALELLDGSPGDVIFGTVTHSRRRPVTGPNKSRNRLVTGTRTPIGFRRIPEPRKVWRMIRDQRARLASMQEDGTP